MQLDMFLSGKHRADSNLQLEKGQSEAVRFPNFFIAGAPKCGTSTLAWWLSRHPQVFMSRQKEPHFFNTDTRRIIKRRDRYYALFADAPENAIAIGEASTRYLRSATAIPNILAEIPDPRFIVCLRNPVDMAISLHNQKIMDGIETIKDFNEAWEAQRRRKEGHNIPPQARTDPSLLFYYDYCLLGQQVERLLTLVPADKVKFVFLDDLSREASSVYDDVVQFLGLDSAPMEDYSKKNVGRGVRSTALRLMERRIYHVLDKAGIPKKPFRLVSHALNRKKSVPSVEPEARKFLWEKFERDIELLAELVGRDLSGWRVL